MLNPEIKKKIVNTISEYEKKCDTLEHEITILKSAIGTLCSIPWSEDDRVKKTVLDIKKDTDKNSDVKVIRENIEHLSSVMTLLQHKKQDSQHQILSYIAHATSLISEVNLTQKDKKNLSKLETLLKSPEEEKLVFEQFIVLLSECISNLSKQINEYKKICEEKENGITHMVTPEISESLLQLLSHLTIPESLTIRSREVKGELSKQLTVTTLVDAVDHLTALVIDAFNVEQNRFKGFLKDITNQLLDFEGYLKLSVDESQARQSETNLLESGLRDNFAEIRQHMESSRTLEELSDKVGKNLEVMGNKLKKFKETEIERSRTYTQQLHQLEEKLKESERNTEEMKNLLAFQKYRVNHDSLTELPNRESFNEHIIEAFYRYERDFGPLCMAIADIDFFKRINDEYGHLAGDKVLKKVAQIFRSTIRAVDFVARFGGEEFVFIFEKTDLDEAMFVAEKLRHAIETCQFSYKESKVDVTISIGIAEARPGDDIERLFSRTDDLLYKAKNNGRNRVER